MLLITASIPFHLDWLVIPPHHYHGIILHLQWCPVFVLLVALQRSTYHQFRTVLLPPGCSTTAARQAAAESPGQKLQH